MMREPDQRDVLISNLTFKPDCLNFIAFTRNLPIPIKKMAEELTDLWSKHKILALYTSHKNARILQDHFSNMPKLITISRRINPNHYPSTFGKYILKEMLFEL